MKETLIFDFDQVIVETDEVWLGYVNKKYNIHTSISDYDSSISLEKNVNRLAGINLSFEEFYYDFTENYTMSKKLHKNVVLLPDAGRVIKESSNKYNLFISTARNSLGIDVIKYILKRHQILNYFNGFHFVYSFDDRMEFIKSSKAEFISSFNGKASFFVDDSPSEIEKTKIIVPSILFDTTKTKIVEGSWSLFDWLEVADFIL